MTVRAASIAMALVVGAAAACRADGQACPATAGSSESAEFSPKGLKDASVIEKLDHGGLEDRFSLNALPYQPAPINVNLDPKTPLKPGAYQPTDKPAAAAPDTESNALAPIVR